MIAKVRAQESEKEFEVYEDNFEAVMLFLRLGTQWVTDNGCFIGLNYGSVEALFRMAKVENQLEMLDSLRVMEIAAINLRNSRSK